MQPASRILRIDALRRSTWKQRMVNTQQSMQCMLEWRQCALDMTSLDFFPRLLQYLAIGHWHNIAVNSFGVCHISRLRDAGCPPFYLLSTLNGDSDCPSSNGCHDAITLCLPSGVFARAICDNQLPKIWHVPRKVWPGTRGKENRMIQGQPISNKSLICWCACCH